MEETEPYEDLIKSLPTDPFGGSPPPLHQYKGFWFRQLTLQGLLATHDYFIPLPSDVLLCSFQKTGTTWLKSLLFSIINRHSKDSLLSTNPHFLIPSLELQIYRGGKLCTPELLEKPSSSSRILSTHIPYQLLPPFVKDSDCKIVYIARNPKDFIVSLWHFMVSNRHHHPVSLQEAVDGICSGVFPGGPYFDHILGYWKESLESSSKRVFFVTYEDLKRDTAGHVRRLGEFLGCPFGVDDEQEVEEIVRICSFETMRNVEVNKNEEQLWANDERLIPRVTLSLKSLFRKGEVGDHVNHLTPEMIERIDEVAKERLSGSGLSLG
ncbi:Cytosolic sulfotransferase 8 [Acorus gramineus]|uniref:Sulfotransferase n=1 Tax=Acorus gramineus TaxID=55184 RepID=A0AAV9BCY0_ACOGR|nr:Cytosolic sulfotransferase 8 [Acorus gramineus]